MITIIYTTVKDQLKAVPKLKELRASTKDKASGRVVEFWQGEIERCDQVLVGDGCGKVADAYKANGTKVFELFEKPKKADEVKPVEVVAEPVPVVEEVKETSSVNSLMDMFDTPTEQPARRGRPRKE